MKKRFPFVVLALGLAFLTACSDDSDSANSRVNEPESSVVAKLDSTAFTASEGACGAENALMKTSVLGNDSIHFVMNKDGSAVLKETMGSVCPNAGEISKISLERQDDTLLVSIKIEYFSESRGPIHHCMCESGYEIDIPTDFVGTKYVTFNGGYLFNTVYKED